MPPKEADEKDGLTCKSLLESLSLSYIFVYCNNIIRSDSKSTYRIWKSLTNSYTDAV